MQYVSTQSQYPPTGRYMVLDYFHVVELRMELHYQAGQDNPVKIYVVHL